jgi:hypothetical protein
LDFKGDFGSDCLIRSRETDMTSSPNDRQHSTLMLEAQLYAEWEAVDMF